MIHKDLTNKEYLSWKDFLRSTEKWTAGDIEQYQFFQLLNVITKAFSTPFYSNLYKKYGVTLDDIRSIEDIQKLPFVTKQDLRDNLEDMTLDTANVEYVTTGGSTGIPTGLFRTKRAFAKELASKAYQYHRVGWKEGDRQVVFRGLLIDTPSKVRYEEDLEELRCSSYHMTQEYLDTFLKMINIYQPEWLRAYPSTAVILASYLKENNLKFPQLKGILSSSENLLDWHKQLFSEVFNARTFTHYGHYEMAVLAGFCEYADTFHVLPQYGYAEILDRDGKRVEVGQAGEVVATSFIMDSTLIIRYRTGDIATLKSWGCPECKRPYQVWDHIDGRIQEFVIAKNNRYISLSSINFHNHIYDHIVEHQFYQDTIGKVSLRYVPKPTCTSEILNTIYNEMKTKLGDVELVLEKVEATDKSMRGKHNLIIQKLPIRGGY